MITKMMKKNHRPQQLTIQHKHNEKKKKMKIIYINIDYKFNSTIIKVMPTKRQCDISTWASLECSVLKLCSKLLDSVSRLVYFRFKHERRIGWLKKGNQTIA